MKMSFERFVIALLVLAVIFTAVPFGYAAKNDPTADTSETAPADVPQGVPEVGTTVTTQYIDPMYADVVSLDDLPQVESCEHPAVGYLGLAENSGIEEAAAAFRNAAKARRSSVTITVKMENYNVDEAAYTVHDAALEHTGVPNEGDYINYNGIGWSASSTYLGYSGGHVFSLTYYFSYFTTAAQEAVVDARVDRLLDELDLWDASDYVKVRTVYDYLCENVTYDYENLYDNNYLLKYTAYAALVDKTAVCQGYAVLFYRLMLELGVDARVIASIEAECHAWNIVRIAGQYYNLDATWDAGSSYYSWFLLSEDNFVDHTRRADYDTLEFHAQYPTSHWNYASWLDPDNGILDEGTLSTGLRWMLLTNNELWVMGEGAIPDFSVGAPWGIYDYRIQHIWIDDGITRIGDYAFCGLQALDGIYIEDGVQSIGVFAFMNCPCLEFVGLPGSLELLEYGAFAYCGNLETVIFYSDAPVIESLVFLGDSILAYYYPNGTWTSSDRLQYGGSVTWKIISDYRITFMNWDGRVYYTDYYSWGSEYYVPFDPIRPDDDLYTYTFIGWTPALTPTCQGEAVYTPVFEAKLKSELTPVGDFTGDEVVSNDDVLYLLWHTLFGDEYVISGNADFNDDGVISNEDVLYLLWHTLFGAQEYPLR